MRTLIPVVAFLSFAFGCSKARIEVDPCARAVANAERLVKESPTAREQYGERPLTKAACRSASHDEVTCIGYASDWNELEGCSPSMLSAR